MCSHRRCGSFVASAECSHRRHDATRQFRRVCVGGVYWTLDITSSYCKFTAHCASETVFKTGQYTTKSWQKSGGVIFWSSLYISVKSLTLHDRTRPQRLDSSDSTVRGTMEFLRVEITATDNDQRRSNLKHRTGFLSFPSSYSQRMQAVRVASLHSDQTN